MHDYKKYFALFGLTEDASQQELRKAYRKLAMQFHPDKNSDPKAQTIFIQLNHAYEILLEYQKNGSSKVNKSHARSKRSNQNEAQKRYKESQAYEKLKEEYYFKKLTSGVKWKVFTWVKNISLLIAILLVVEKFLPSHFTTKTVTAYSDFYNGMEQNSVRCLLTEDGQKMWVENPTVRMFYENPIIQVEESFIFRNPVNVWFQEHDFLKQYPIDFSANNLFPVVPFLFIIPFITYRYKRKNYLFTIGYIFSFYLVGSMLLWFLLTQDRWLHLLTFGVI